MKIIVDTNVLIAALGKTSPYRKIFEGFRNNAFTLIVSVPILLEYSEVIAFKTTATISENVVKAIITAKTQI